MKNLYFKSINFKHPYLVILIAIFIGNIFTTDAQVKKVPTQRTSTYTPTKKIYNIQGDFTMLGNTNLTPQSYDDNVNNNSSTMQYVDIDADPNTWNSSSSTLALSTVQAAPTCVYLPGLTRVTRRMMMPRDILAQSSPWVQSQAAMATLCTSSRANKSLLQGLLRRQS